jgi:hypothetical protein
VPPRGRAARPLLLRSVVAFSLVVLPDAALSATVFDDLLADLSGEIANLVATGETVRVTAATAEHASHAQALSSLLERRGMRIAQQPEGITTVTCSCAVTLRERVCVALVRKAGTSQLVEARRPADNTSAPPLSTPMVLELRPLVNQRAPILDVVATDTRMLVLDPSSVSRYDRTEQGWRLRDAKAIASTRGWPRDVRGRIVATSTSFEAYLPGVVCRGAIDPLSVSCVEQQAAWPIGIENQGITSARNYFSLSSGVSVYTLAPLDSDAGAKWMAVTRDNQLVMVDAAGTAIDPPIAAGDEVARLTAPCASGNHVLTTSTGFDGGDAIRLFRVAERQLRPATPPAVLPGSLTAMWPAADTTTATVVSRNPVTGGYEAFQVRVSCGR